MNNCFICLEHVENKDEEQSFNGILNLNKCNCYTKQVMHNICFEKAIKYKNNNCIFCNQELVINNNNLIQENYTEVMMICENGLYLQYVKEQTQELCLEAVKQNGCALNYVKEQTDDICLEAVKQNGYALQFVKIHTDEICLEAVKQDGYALQFVKVHIDEICLEAVKQNAYALQSIYLEDSTILSLEE